MSVLAEKLKTHLDPRYAIQFSRFVLAEKEQNQIISSILDDRSQGALKAVDLSYDFWLAKSLRHLDISTVPSYYQNQKVSRVEFLFRHHPTPKWIWAESDLSHLVQAKLREFDKAHPGVIQYMTRVKIHLQEPGRRVPFHRDLTAGHTYNLKNELSTDPGPHSLRYKMSDWVRLEDFNLDFNLKSSHNGFSLKLPLSQRFGFYGKPLMFDQGVCEYTSNGSYYLLNESQPHAADPVEYYRGLIFVDGIFDVSKLKPGQFDHLQCLRHDG